MTATLERTALAADFTAAPTGLRLRDFAKESPRDLVYVANGMASDAYRLVPTVGFDHRGQQVPEQDGAYRVPSLKADPERTGDSPDLVDLVTRQGARDRRPMRLRRHHGLPVVMVRGQNAHGDDLHDLYVLEDPDDLHGRAVYVSRPYLDSLTVDAVEDRGQEFRPFSRGETRFTVYADPGDLLTAVLVVRSAYGRASYVDGKTERYPAGKWEALLMPVTWSGNAS